MATMALRPPLFEITLKHNENLEGRGKKNINK
jgi:hypothetical protein